MSQNGLRPYSGILFQLKISSLTAINSWNKPRAAFKIINLLIEICRSQKPSKKVDPDAMKGPYSASVRQLRHVALIRQFFQTHKVPP
jgi:hypothetical protein